MNAKGHVYERARNVPFDRAGCSDGKALGLPVLPSKAGKKHHAHHDWRLGGLELAQEKIKPG